ncbi:GNAT family N-acetyltransferase [Paenibacillus sp. JX-17]|uniref:GNAT family N-acetyltransferase n=1 Tax=Paenibacillus lacisoli TaxID=3064525 RepID=A0ABT9CA56_9BACL|nr:GNAT family N-acetyltransferase [Paenibacillus sp. JX-17]MDO7906137.1 GNAT family N-acetyltransferase [Paenibacillus sp. JX-17]
MQIEQVHEYDIDEELRTSIYELLMESFPEVYPKHRIYFKQLPHFRFIAFDKTHQLAGQVGLDYRVMNLSGRPVRILGIIDLCVSSKIRSQGIGSALLKEIDRFAAGRSIDFILLFADQMNLYLNNGYSPYKNMCKWLKIDHKALTMRGIGAEAMNELMIKRVRNTEWNEGELDMLGYLY